MRHYLIVAHETGDSPALLGKVEELTRQDPETAFVVLTPRRPVSVTRAAGGDRRSSTEVALWRAQRTAARLRAVGARVLTTRLGGFDPLRAIREEMAFGDYAGVIISMLPPGLSAWLHLGLPWQVKSRWPQLEVIHVVTPSPYHLETTPAVPPAALRGAAPRP